MNAEIVDQTVSFSQKMKIKLLELKKEIISNLMQENEELQEITATGKTPKDFAEIASDDVDKRILETLGARDYKLLNLISAALGRIENGTYGKCLKSGKAISHERLEALPYALYCIDVQRALDKKRRA